MATDELKCRGEEFVSDRECADPIRVCTGQPSRWNDHDEWWSGENAMSSAPDATNDVKARQMNALRKEFWRHQQSSKSRVETIYVFWDITLPASLVSYLAYSSTVSIEAICSSETSVKCQRTRQYPTSWNVEDCLPDEVIVFCSWPNPSSRTRTLRSAQPPTEMSSRNLPGVWTVPRR
jgi:hypothetical protein